MAIFKNGINGPFSGKVGPVVGTSWRGLNIIRSLPKRPTSFSEKQLANQMKMKLMQSFLKSMIEVVRIGFHDSSRIPTAFNAAMSFNKKHAIKGTYPDLKVDYASVKLAEGLLSPPDELAFIVKDGGIEFTWDGSSGPNCKADDQLLAVLWKEGSDKAEYRLQAYRNSGKYLYETTADLKSVHVWAAFVSLDRTEKSDSKYLRMIE